MSSRIFTFILATVVIASGIFLFSKQSGKPPETILGVKHPELSSNHIARGQKPEPYNSDPPSSGQHYADALAPAPWGVYIQEVPAEVFIHNQEHGGVIITYRPDLPADQLKQLQALFAPPYSNKNFSPIKAIVTPRAANKHPIQLAAWTYTLDLDQYDEEVIIKFYLQRVGKAPEPTAGPNNAPINQATN